jgi:hypothetical protein
LLLKQENNQTNKETYKQENISLFSCKTRRKEGREMNIGKESLIFSYECKQQSRNQET